MGFPRHPDLHFHERQMIVGIDIKNSDSKLILSLFFMSVPAMLSLTFRTGAEGSRFHLPPDSDPTHHS